MKNLDAKRFALALFAVFALCLVGLAYARKEGPSDLWGFLKLAYKTIPLVLLVVGIFVAYAWRWRIFHGWLVPFPNLNGTWIGTIQTTWKDPATGQVPGPIPAMMTIKQSFHTISCVVRTAEMTSRSCLADFWLNRDEQIKMLGYTYHHKPDPAVRPQNPAHEGSALFEVIGKPEKKLKGTYWSSRGTSGSMVLAFHGKERLEEMPAGLAPHPVSGRSA